MDFYTSMFYNQWVAPMWRAVTVPAPVLSIGQSAQINDDASVQTQQEIQNRAEFDMIMQRGMVRYDVMDGYERDRILAVPGLMVQSMQTADTYATSANLAMYARHTHPIGRTATRNNRLPQPNFAHGGIADTRAESAIWYGAPQTTQRLTHSQLQRDLEQRQMTYGGVAQNHNPLSTRQQDFVDAMPKDAWSTYGAPARQMIRGDDEYAYNYNNPSSGAGPSATSVVDAIAPVSAMVGWSSGSARK